MAPIRAKKWINNALRRLRLNTTLDGVRPMSQHQVAAAIGVGLDRYFHIEMDRVIATPREERALARLFKVRERDLGLPKVLPSNRVTVRQVKTKARVKVRRAS